MKLKTARSAKDGSTGLNQRIKANRLEEWKSGDRASFTGKEQLLVELVNYLKDHEGKRWTNQSLEKELQDEKQPRKNRKMIDAATFGKRKCRTTGALELTSRTKAHQSANVPAKITLSRPSSTDLQDGTAATEAGKSTFAGATKQRLKKKAQFGLFNLPERKLKARISLTYT